MFLLKVVKGAWALFLCKCLYQAALISKDCSPLRDVFWGDTENAPCQMLEIKEGDKLPEIASTLLVSPVLTNS